jgi:hypothetical protein
VYEKNGEFCADWRDFHGNRKSFTSPRTAG